MKQRFLILAASLALVGPVQAGSVAGARDGDYRAADGDLVLVASADDRVSLDGLDCMHPVVRGNRILSKDCWGNGHRDANLDAEWRVQGDVIVLRGKRFTLLPPPPQKPKAPTQPVRVESAGRPWDHNGSVVMVDPPAGTIAYLEPRASLRPLVGEGTVLFRGPLHPDRPVVGTAYAFKAGCAPAPYPVRGTYTNGANTLTLRGAGPVRRGCEVVGYSATSPHAVLRFTYLLDD